ncbi:MAG: hypothetical protein AAF478_11125 [Pseudomonadota bacterium]
METILASNNQSPSSGLASPRWPSAIDGRPYQNERNSKVQGNEDKAPLFTNKLAFLVLVFATLALVFALLLYAVAVLFGEDISRVGHSTSTTPIEVVIANNALAIPANTIRYSNQRKAGLYNRVEMYLHWPSMRGYNDKLAHVFNRTGSDASLLFVSLEPRQMSLEMSGRLGPIYSKFFAGPAQKSASGLIKQPLSSEGGFVDEYLYYEADSPYPYVTRCERSRSNVNTPFCIRDIHVTNDLMLTYRFHAKFLPQWLEIERGIRSYVSDLIING